MTIVQRAGLLCVGFLVPFLQTSPPANPPALTLREAVEIIADYEVRHPRVPDFTPYWGMTDYERRVIYAIDNGDLAIRRDTAIHEMIHVARRLRGEQLPTREEEEAFVAHETARLYRELFGTSR